ncbi:unnamed protein product [Cochlearia groenlandica]
MMSIEPAFSFAEPGLVNQLPDFQTGFTPWDFDFSSDLFSLIQSSLEPVIPSPCSGKPKTGSDETKTEITDDRKRKRMESNRESAKRSRIRKQRHIENLRDEVNRLGLENRELKNRLRLVMYHIEHICTDNNRLLSEQEILRRRFFETRQILILRQLLYQQQ